VVRYASEDLLERRDLVLACVARHWGALAFAPHALQGDPEVVLAAAQQTGHALEHASEGLRGDREFMAACAARHPAALAYATEGLLADQGFIIAVAKASSLALQHLPARFRNDREVQRARALGRNGPSFVLWPREPPHERVTQRMATWLR
jgi:hypothetical protein